MKLVSDVHKLQSVGVPTVLAIDTHLRHVKNAIFEARSQWKEIGRSLNLSDGTIRSIHESDDGERLHQVLSLWIQAGSATIHNLLNALEDVSVGRNDIANEIRSLKSEQRVNVGL